MTSTSRKPQKRSEAQRIKRNRRRTQHQRQRAFRVARRQNIAFIPLLDNADKDTPSVQVPSVVVVATPRDEQPPVNGEPALVVPKPTLPLPTPEEVWETIPEVDPDCLTLCVSPTEVPPDSPSPLGIARKPTRPTLITVQPKLPLIETPRIARAKPPRRNNTPQRDPRLITKAKRRVFLVKPGTKLNVQHVHELPSKVEARKGTKKVSRASTDPST